MDYFSGQYGVGADPLTGLPMGGVGAPAPVDPYTGRPMNELDANAFRHGFNDPRYTFLDPLARLKHAEGVEHAAHHMRSLHHMQALATANGMVPIPGFPGVGPHAGHFPMAHGNPHAAQMAELAHREQRLRAREREIEVEMHHLKQKRHHRANVDPEYEDVIIGADSLSAVAANGTGTLVSTPVVDVHISRLVIPSGYGATVAIQNFQIGMRIFNSTGIAFSGMSFSEQSRIMLPLDFGVIAAGTQIITTVINLGTSPQRFVFSYHGRDMSRHCSYGPDGRQMNTREEVRHEGYSNHPHGTPPHHPGAFAGYPGYGQGY